MRDTDAKMIKVCTRRIARRSLSSSYNSFVDIGKSITVKSYMSYHMVARCELY